jgi:regulator of protease activity HflC (stomatin/prohibitin superfamily)
MFFIFLLIVLMAIPFIAFTAVYVKNKQYSESRNENIKRENSRLGEARYPLIPLPKFKWFTSTGISLLIGVVFVGLESFTVVPAGHIGVQVTFGNVNQQTLDEGIHFVNPLSSIRNVDVRLVTAEIKNASAGTKDLQQVHTDVVVYYRISGDKAAHIYKEFGLDLQDRIIMPIVSESFKSVTAHYTSEELITKRDQVSAQIRQELSEKLNKYNILISDISIVNFGFSPEYQKAIESKVIATQSKLQAEQDLARIEVEALQAVAKAKGKAEAIKIETEAINSQGGAAYVSLKAIERWDGKLPQMMSGDTIPFVNVGGAK